MDLLQLNKSLKLKIIKKLDLQLLPIESLSEDIYSDVDRENLVLLKEDLSSEELKIISKSLSHIYQDKYEKFDKKLIQVSYHDCLEPLVSITNNLSENLEVVFSDEKFPDFCENYAGQKRMFLIRQNLKPKLIKLFQVANKMGYIVKILDGFRPKTVQKNLYLNTFKRIRQSFPKYTLKEIIIEANSKTAFAPWAAGHMTGAALDIQLISKESGQVLEIGNPYRGVGVITNMDFPFLTLNQLKARLIFYKIVTQSGFSIYSAENWHISSGDITAALESDMRPVYGPVKYIYSDNQTMPFDKVDVYGNFFSEEELKNIYEAGN